MKLIESAPLAPLSTLGVGGEARFLVEAHTEADVREAAAFARDRHLPLFVLGGGSNVLIPDDPVKGAVLRVLLQDTKVTESGDELRVEAEAGASWDQIVEEVLTHGFYGIENLAGIPGSLGGATVQNIGAYGAELSRVFDYADVIEASTGRYARIPHADADLSYRTSRFKKQSELVIVRVALRLSRRTQPNLAYPDLAKAASAGVPLQTPHEIARAVRAIRARKFPNAPGEGTAGSFFKNPVVSNEQYAALQERFSDLPAFPVGNGMMKIPLAWILDHILHLKGYAVGPVRLYEKQPLVVVASSGATARAIDAFARNITARVHAATGILVEREVETFGARAARAFPA